MAKGKPKKWATARLSEPIALGKAGIEIVIWDKWRKTRRGTAIISVGGIRWYPCNAKKPYSASWNVFDQWMTSE